MSRRMMSDVCNEAFFIALNQAFPPGSAISAFLTEYYKELAVHFIVNYSKLPVLEYLPEEGLANIVAARYGHSLERIGLALYQSYNPLHNTDVEEIETNDGSDSHHYTGTDTNRVQRNHTKTDYNQLTNSALTSGSTYDDTAEDHMKPISKTEHEFHTEQTSDNDGVATTEYGKNLEMEYGREVTKTKAGNIGVMPTQNLLELEYYTRLRMTLFDAVVRACCNTLGCGVWED